MNSTRLFALFTAIGLLLASPAGARGHKSWGTASTVAAGALIATGLGLPAIREDWRGDVQAAGSIGAAFVLSEGLKHTFPDRRPDGSDELSFPSGHASTAFAAAATLENRYGWRVGVPAQLVAAFVGVARVQAGKHAWDDVLVGAAIGEAIGFLITSKRDASVRLTPWGGTKSGGMTAAVRF